jgi:hypothetical protein
MIVEIKITSWHRVRSTCSVAIRTSQVAIAGDTLSGGWYLSELRQLPGLLQVI